MTGSTYSEAGLHRYLERLQEICRQRDVVWRHLLDGLEAMFERLEVADGWMMAAGSRLSAAETRRPNARRYILVSWQSRRLASEDGRQLGSVLGPYLDLVDKDSGRKKRVNSLTAQHIRRLCRPEFEPELREERARLREAHRQRERALRALTSIARRAAWVEPVDRLDPELTRRVHERPVPRSVSPSMVPAFLSRRRSFEVLLRRVTGAMAGVRAVEQSLDEHLVVVNAAAKRNRNLVCSWELPALGKGTVGGPVGPVWGQLRKGPRARMKSRLRRRVTRDLLRQCYQERQAEVLLPRAKSIESLKTDRRSFIQVLLYVNKIVSTGPSDR